MTENRPSDPILVPRASGMIPLRGSPLRKLELTPREVRALLDDQVKQIRSPLAATNSYVNGTKGEECRGGLDDWEHLDFFDAALDFGPAADGQQGPCVKITGQFGARQRIRPQVQVGDRYWVAEPWNQHGGLVTHLADGDWILEAQLEPNAPKWVREKLSWLPGSAMPRWACRLTLEVTRVDVERLVDGPAKTGAYVWVYGVTNILGTYDDDCADLFPRSQDDL